MVFHVSAKIQSRALDLFLSYIHPDACIGKSDGVKPPNRMKTSPKSLPISRGSIKCVKVGCTSVLSVSQRFVYEPPRAARELILPSASCPCGSLRFMEPCCFPSSPAPSCKITCQYGWSRPRPPFEIEKFLFGDTCSQPLWQEVVGKQNVGEEMRSVLLFGRGEKPGL